MNEDNKNERNNDPENNGGKLLLFIVTGLLIAGGIALGLSFTVLGIYSLIASLLFEFVAMILINLQKRKTNLKWLRYLEIAAYVLFVATALVLLVR